MKLTTIGVMGVAYVLGARAGRDRYEQIRALAEQAAQRLEAYGSDGTLATGANEWWQRHGAAPTRRE